MSETQKHSFISILLVEDHALMRRGMRSQFALEPDFLVIGEAADGIQAVELAKQLKPDMVLMDIDLPLMDGITATQQIKSTCLTSHVLALTAFDRDSQVIAMLAAGADGYCLKSMEWEQLIAVIRLIQSGGTYLDTQVARKVFQILKPTSESKTSAVQSAFLSQREREVLKLIAQGYSNQEIAQQLYLSLGTVKSYVRMILNKLSVDDRVQAAAKAVRERLI
ncbi:response regulator transcription factor [Gloeocapsopsis crepidinum LEGE 06123]|uniref:Response regulator transcription factor n=1 Tax=Gloeocapsopsis crepidinum LEGE 06123 TaxID=588587 RepID=A0ABR9UTB9_9CHRO|nr:response regulator transcription factor [Gloeocapsopsis crepidinum]MBE9191527.1 response regulator transcription factor [Gloeocapsopsis crepidinum LEGE 06123]